MPRRFKPELKTTKLKQDGYKIKYYDLTSDRNTPIHIIERRAKQLMNKRLQKDTGGEYRFVFQMNLKYTKRGSPIGFRASKLFDDEDDFHTFNDMIDDYDNNLKTQQIFSYATLVVYKYKIRGGANANNDCLYQCLSKAVINHEKYIGASDKAFKRRLDVPVNEPVSVYKLKEIDEMLPQSVGLHVSGQLNYYISTKKNHIPIYIRLSNGHYELEERRLFKIRGYGEKPIAVYYQKDTKNVIYDGEKIVKKSINEWREYSKDLHIYKTTANDEESLIEEYNLLMEDYQTLLKETDGLINLKLVNSISDMSVYLFREMTRYRDYPETIMNDEADWINKASMAAIIYNRKGFKGEAYPYDINSHYPHIMSKSNTFFPVSSGAFEKIEQLDMSNLKYGIYRCQITNTVNYKFFRFNKQNYYTHIDILHANRLGMKIELIQDETPNALMYDNIIRGDYLFGDFVKYLFEKKQTCTSKTYKSLLNNLWGKLCQSKKMKWITDKNEEEIVIGANRKIDYIIPLPSNDISNEKYRISLVDINNPFHHSYARFKPFILAYGRSYISQIAQPYQDNIVRIHTDSVWFDTDIELKTSDKLGSLKKENMKIID